MADMTCLECGRMWSEHRVDIDAGRAHCPEDHRIIDDSPQAQADDPTL